jgi:flagellar M-ring protein FliF
VLNTFWSDLNPRAQAGFIAGLAAILVAMAAFAYWALRTDYAILFSDLSPQDASAMARELDLMKTPYRLGDDGNSILVERGSVHATRLKLMGRELPLSGAVGFELFNNTDFGMTEFAQKVNYQRALQGEITRTILSLSEVESARVHLVLPEGGLFKREHDRAKASITLALRHGRSVQRDQVAGIQRLVAAAVPGISRDDVTIVNQQGVALTQAEAADGAAASSARLDLKREVEQHLALKANAVLEKAFGPGQAMASVDVTLDMNQVRTTTEDVTTPPAASGEAPGGVILRERETLRDDPGRGDPGTVQATSTHREVDYQLGRRVEQIASSPGAIVRLQALAVLKAPLSAAQVEQVRALLGAAVGSSTERGDKLVVQPLGGLAAAVVPDAEGAVRPTLQGGAGLQRTQPVASPLALNVPVTWMLVLLALGCVVGAFAALRARARRPLQVQRALTGPQREASLEQVRAWLIVDRTAAGDRMHR